jgi:uncharacterized membrane protein
MTAEDEEAGVIQGSTTPGTAAPYILTILNIGGKSAQIRMESTDPPLLWSTTFTKTSFNLGAGNDEDVTFNVKPGLEIGGGNSTTLTVTATVDNDPAIPKAKDFLQVETSVRDNVGFVIAPENPDPKTVGVGGTVDHVFTLRNIGEEDTDVDLKAEGIPSGWQVVFTGDRVSNNVITQLRSMEIVDIVLRVTAPSTSDSDTATIKVTCTSESFPEVFEDVTFETKLVIGLVLTPKNDPPDPPDPLDPGGSFILYFEAYNNDPTSSHDITFSIDQRTSSWPSATSFRFTPSTLIRLNADSRSDLGLTVDVPDNAEAGDFRFTLRGIVDNNVLVSAKFDFNITISVRNLIEVRLEPSSPEVTVGTKEDSVIFLTVENSGNVVETVNVTVVVSGGDVIVEIDGIKSSKDVTILDPGESQEFKISFRAEDTAANNQEMTVRIQVVRKGDTTPITPNDFKLVVKKTNSEVFLDFIKKFWIMIILLFAMVYLMVYRPKSRRPVEAPPEEEDAEAHHGTVAKT